MNSGMSNMQILREAIVDKSWIHVDLENLSSLDSIQHSSFHAPGDDLELVELQSEDASRVLDEGAHAQRARRRPRVQCRRKVPHLKQNIMLLV